PEGGVYNFAEVMETRFDEPHDYFGGPRRVAQRSTWRARPWQPSGRDRSPYKDRGRTGQAPPGNLGVHLERSGGLAYLSGPTTWARKSGLSAAATVAAT